MSEREKIEKDAKVVKKEADAARADLAQARPSPPLFLVPRNRITTCCYPDRAAAGPRFVPGLPHGVDHSRRPCPRWSRRRRR